MEPRLKQRLVGATVLVALAVIFLPELLRPTGDRRPSEVELELPPPPRPEPALSLPPAPPAAVEPPAPSVARPPADTGQGLAAADADPAAGQDEPASASALRVSPDLAAWAVQLGSFGDPENATRLQARLREAGFRAYTEQVEAQGRTLQRVRVGPEPSRADAERLQAEIAARLGIEGIIRRHP
jgi:DedD protein